MVFGAGFVVGNNHAPALAQGTAPANTDKLFEPFWQAWNLVHGQYVDPIDDDALMQGAITGMMSALGDPHTAYMDPKLYNSLVKELDGEGFEGIGATVRKDTSTGGLKIIGTLPGSPAREAGVRAGDIIMTVDDEDITAQDETQIVGKVRGPAGTTVTLGLLRTGTKNLIRLTITRARIDIPTVETTMYQGGIGYIKLTQFTASAGQEFANALRKLNANKLKGLIFDLRDNPGGGLLTAVDIASEFLKAGPIVIERGKPGTEQTILSSTGKTLAPDVPLVILVNAGSASASELVSGALHDRGRAILVGIKTYGKGSVQAWEGLINGGGVRITIAHFFTPTGRVINEVGLTPDVIIDWDQAANPDFDPQLAEAILILRGEL